MASMRRVRNQVRDLRAEVAPGRQQRLIAVSTVFEADEVRSRLAGEDALIVVTGVPRGS